MTSYRAKFFDGQAPLAQAVEVVINGDFLEIKDGEKIVDRWPMKLVSRDPRHLSTAVLLCQGDEARLELLDKSLLEDKDFKSSAKGSKTLKFNSRIAMALILAVAILVVSIIFSIKPVTKFLAGQISHQSERKLLEKVTSFSNPQMCALTLEQNFALEKLLSRIYPLDEMDRKMGVQVRAIASSDENAIALPGSEIWIYSELIRKSESPEELAGVLAHEIEHIKKRHILETIVRGTMLTTLLSVALGDVSGVLLVDPQTAMSLLSLSFSRDMESEADSGALDRLKAAEVSPQGLVSFFERSKSGIAGKIPKFLSSHPINDDRIQKFKQTEGTTRSPLLTVSEWQTLKTVCK